MKNKVNINYLFRKRLPQYNSIEELFGSIKNVVSQTNETSLTELQISGGSPFKLLGNLVNFRKASATLYHITGDVHYMGLVTGKYSVLTIHDVGSANRGHILRRLYILLFWFWLPAFFVKRITVISEFTKKELIKIIPFAERKIIVVHNPLNPLFRLMPKVFNVEKPVILLLGTKPNKNLERIFIALKDLSCELLIIGALSTKQQQLLAESNLTYTNKINITLNEVVTCYETCDILCFPSLYEGFGMPVIEAQAIGRPVLTSNLSSMPEVAGEGAYMIDPYNTESIKNGILKIISDENFRNSLIVKGLENIQRFKIEKISKDYLRIYREILKNL